MLRRHPTHPKNCSPGLSASARDSWVRGSWFGGSWFGGSSSSGFPVRWLGVGKGRSLGWRTVAGAAALLISQGLCFSAPNLSGVSVSVAAAEDLNTGGGTPVAVAPGTFLGVASCASSNCHGAAVPRKTTSVLQNEYTTWLKYDTHALAWKALLSEDSKRIAHHMGIAAPEKEPLCLRCHATYVPDSAKGEKFQVEDGVSCESCHGAAGGWIQTHTATGATHADNISHGLKDSHSLAQRAPSCLTCHYGTENQQVNHRLIGAGHPRLSFELDTFSQLQPKHWEVDEDYLKRKGPYNSAQAWLIGQIALASSTLDALRSPTRSRDGIWPEPTLFHCFACHHSLTEDQWKVREYGGRPGWMPLNLSTLKMSALGLTALRPSEGARLVKLMQDIAGQYHEGKADKSIAEAQQLLRTAREQLGTSEPFTEASSRALLKGLATEAATLPHPQYEKAEQLAMAISSVLETLPAEKARLKGAVDRVFDSLKTPKAFQPDPFTAASAALRAKI